MSLESARDFYMEIFRILESAKLKSSVDLLQIKYRDNGWGIPVVISLDYPWVEEIVLRFHRGGPSLMQPYLQSEGPRLFYGRPYSPINRFDWTVTDHLFSVRANYSCLFPKRIVYLSHQFKYWESGNSSITPRVISGIPLDFLVQLFPLKPALLNELALLVPSRVAITDEYGESSELWGTFYEVQRRGAMVLEADGRGYASLSKHQSERELSLVESQLVKTPWLVGVQLEDFVSLVDKHRDEFFLYSSAFNRFFKDKDADVESLAEWLAELAVATKALDVVLRKKRRELVRKGVDVAVGTVCTIATLLLPDTFSPVKAILTTAFGTKTAQEALMWVRDFANAREDLSHDQYWVLWQSIRQQTK